MNLARTQRHMHHPLDVHERATGSSSVGVEELAAHVAFSQFRHSHELIEEKIASGAGHNFLLCFY